MRHIARLAVAVVLAFAFAMPARAEDPAVIKRLRTEPTTLYDVGMKGLRRLALDAAPFVGAVPGAKTSVSVSYQTDDGVIRIDFWVPVRESEPVEWTYAKCVELRRDALIEMFKVGRASYDRTVGIEERIRRRLGAQFAHEQNAKNTEILAVGERLSEMTTFEMVLTGRVGARLNSCIGRVDNLAPKQPPM